MMYFESFTKLCEDFSEAEIDALSHSNFNSAGSKSPNNFHILTPKIKIKKKFLIEVNESEDNFILTMLNELSQKQTKSTNHCFLFHNSLFEYD